jgi:hypothetical protein
VLAGCLRHDAEGPNWLARFDRIVGIENRIKGNGAFTKDFELIDVVLT